MRKFCDTFEDMINSIRECKYIYHDHNQNPQFAYYEEGGYIGFKNTINY